MQVGRCSKLYPIIFPLANDFRVSQNIPLWSIPIVQFPNAHLVSLVVLSRWCTSLHHVMIWIDLVLSFVQLHVNLIWWLLLVHWQIKWLQHWDEYTIKCQPHDMSFLWAHVLMGVVIITTGKPEYKCVDTNCFLVIPLSEVLIELFQLMFTFQDVHHPLKPFSMAFFFSRYFYKTDNPAH